MKKYKIKMEDKAALLNRLKKYNIPVDTTEIQDNELEGYFNLTISDPTEVEIVNALLKKSPKIDVLKEFLRKEVRKILKEIEVHVPGRNIEWDYNEAFIDDYVQDEDGDSYGIGTIYGKRNDLRYVADFSVPLYRDGEPNFDKVEIYNIKRSDI